ncbi:MAG: hypothetical protein ACK5NT_00440 [Pyrinomonadaceae bacterium]
MIVSAYTILIFTVNIERIHAQTTSKLINFHGAITEISKAHSTVSVLLENNSSYIVEIEPQSSLRLVRAGETTLTNAVSITINQIEIGDQCFIRGVSSGTNKIKAAQIVIVKKSDIEERQRLRQTKWEKIGVSGVIESIDKDLKRITVKVPTSNQVIRVLLTESSSIQRYPEGAKSINEFESSDISKMNIGDQIRALGENDQASGDYIASEIFSGFFRTISGKVVSKDLSNGELELIDSSTNTLVKISVRGSTNIRKLYPTTKTEPGNISAPEKKGKINLNAFFANAKEIGLSDINPGDLIAVASASRNNSQIISALTIVSGLEILSNANDAQNGTSTTLKFNLDVF